MSFSSGTRGIIFAAILGVVACDEMPEDSDFRYAAGRYEGTDPWLLNGLGSLKFLAAAAIDEKASLESQVDDIDPDVLSYVAQCALEEGDSLDGFDGLLGIAPEWRNGSCDTECQETMTACLAAVVNDRGSRLIHVKGDAVNANTNGPAGLRAEAAFFGNMFVFPPEAMYCTISSGLESLLDERLCSNAGPTCAVLGVGKCSSYFGPRCRESGGDVPYETDCRRPVPGPLGWKRFPAITAYQPVEKAH